MITIKYDPTMAQISHMANWLLNRYQVKLITSSVSQSRSTRDLFNLTGQDWGSTTPSQTILDEILTWSHFAMLCHDEGDGHGNGHCPDSL